VTRAKQMTRVVTSLRPEDIKVVETSSGGVQATQAYLRYAAGGADFDNRGTGETDSDFELFVAERLRGAGYEVDHQVGVEGFRIDLGVRHPSFPLGYIAGVECDGAAFHSGMTVRDRDKIRQSILERLGWNIYRIWSTDWFASADQEMARLLGALEQWRDKAAASYEARRQSGDLVSLEAAIDPDIEVPPPNFLVAVPEPNYMVCEPEPQLTDPAASIAQPESLTRATAASAAEPEPASRASVPSGKRRDLDGIAWFEVMTGTLFEVWPDEEYGGEVEVISRSVAAPRLYSGAAAVQRSQYRGSVDATGNSFLIDDLYAAVRRVAREAREARVPAA
jgi:very-short-patch-repair endonuclease